MCKIEYPEKDDCPIVAEIGAGTNAGLADFSGAENRAGTTTKTVHSPGRSLKSRFSMHRSLIATVACLATFSLAHGQAPTPAAAAPSAGDALVQGIQAKIAHKAVPSAEGKVDPNVPHGELFQGAG